MKNRLLPIALLFGLSVTQAQKSTKAFALTDFQKNGFQWNQIQSIDLTTGNVIKTVLDGRKSIRMIRYDTTGIISNSGSINNPAVSPLSQSSAALAYDEPHNRLYFSAMFQLGEIRFVNLSDTKPSVYISSFSQKINNSTDHEADNITRMVIGSDGFGYAITNDGNSFIQFTTTNIPKIKNLGSLIDDNANGAVSVHSRTTSWGGDLVADAFGKLFLITVNRNVFKINPNTLIASYVGAIKGLPFDYTCNGAAVNADGKLVVTSAVKANGYYSLNLEDLNAVLLSGSDSAFNTSDLATSNLYGQNKVDNSLANMNSLVLDNVVTNDKISIYPNPVTDGNINLSFKNLGSGSYLVTLLDQAGHTIIQKQVYVSNKSQTASINTDKKLAKGMYYVKVSDANKQQVFSSSVLVQ